jgi:HSP20 family protein
MVVAPEGGEAMPTLVKWPGVADLETLEQRMRRYFDDFSLAPPHLPAVDAYETEEELVVELEVPGFDVGDLDVAITDHSVTVTGDRKDEAEAPERTSRLHERLEAHFERRFALPLETDSAKLTAEYGKGVLTLHVPKLKVTEPRKVRIKTT